MCAVTDLHNAWPILLSICINRLRWCFYMLLQLPSSQLFFVTFFFFVIFALLPYFILIFSLFSVIGPFTSCCVSFLTFLLRLHTSMHSLALSNVLSGLVLWLTSKTVGWFCYPGRGCSKIVISRVTVSVSTISETALWSCCVLLFALNLLCVLGRIFVTLVYSSIYWYVLFFWIDIPTMFSLHVYTAQVPLSLEVISGVFLSSPLLALC